MIDLRHDHLQIVLEILAEHVPDCQVWAFGSRVRGKAKPHSDLDLAVRGDGILDFARLGHLEEAFEESDLPMRVDVVD
jgi:predicted nucleotidyltransferase